MPVNIWQYIFSSRQKHDVKINFLKLEFYCWGEMSFSELNSSQEDLDHCCHLNKLCNIMGGLLWPCSYGSWIYNYLCDQCPSPLMLWVRISIRARCTTLCDQVCQWLVTGRWLSPCTLVFFTNKADCHDIIEILLKVALNTIKQTVT